MTTPPNTPSAAPTDKLIEDMTNAFLRWPLPDSVCADLCATMQGYAQRVGTNLLGFTEAKAMFTEIVGPQLDALRAEILKELIPVERYAQALKNRVPISVVCNVVKACALTGHDKYALATQTPSPLADQVAPSLNAGKSRESRDEGTTSGHTPKELDQQFAEFQAKVAQDVADIKGTPVTPESIAAIQAGLKAQIKRDCGGDAAPATPEAPISEDELAAIKERIFEGFIQCGPFARKLIRHIDWQAARIAELTAKGDDVTYQRECFEALQAIPVEFVQNDYWVNGVTRLAASHAVLNARLTAATADRCDHCGARLVPNCQRCGAPTCCPQCCKISELEEKLTAAQSVQPKAVEWESRPHDLNVYEDGMILIGIARDADNARKIATRHAAVVADITTALNLANARAEGAARPDGWKS